MNRERWVEIRALFDELADADQGTRAARLAALGAADPAARREVEALLESDADAEQRLARMFAPAGPVRDPLGLSGRTLSHFRVGEPLGAGGMGVVYAAEDTGLGRQVALKVPHAALGLDPSGRRRFVQEARSAAALEHPNLCSIHEVGESEDGLLFLAMPLYRGETLRTRLARDGALPPDQAIDITRQLARGLAAAHAAGIVHRDLKPANVMILPDGLVKVLDFGLARAHALGGPVTGGALGTPAYMAPEQIRAEPVDVRTDLWALGVVLYEMVTGRKPFRGEHDASLAHAIVYDAPDPPGAVAPGLPGGLGDLILELLAKDPASRPRDASVVEQRLAGIRADAPVPEGGFRRRVPRVRVLATAAGIIVAVLAAAAALARRSGTPAGAAEAGLIAIAPFDAAGPGLELWREGLTDILARDLDGAGPLRTVPPSVALRRWRGRADRPSAEALGARTGAGIVVFGSVVRRDTDSVGIRVTLLDRARGALEPDIEVVGAEQRMGELADSLGVRILRVLGRTRPIASARHVSIGSRSLPALKEFLRGEQSYRAGQWDSALAHYDRAIAGDSTFALALRRMGWALGAGAPSSWRYAPQIEYMRRATRLNRGLSPRDSILLTADSLELFTTGPDGEAIVAAYYRAIRSVEELARRYPDDPSAWYELGERLNHLPLPLGGRAAAALEAFDRAIALDSGFAPAYMHVVKLATRLGQPERARAYARAFIDRQLPREQMWDLHLVQAIFDSGGIHAPAVRRKFAGSHAIALNWVSAEHLAQATDADEAVIWVLREMRSGRHSVQGGMDFVTDSFLTRQRLAEALAFRGHLREAVEVGAPGFTDTSLARRLFHHDPFVDLALLGRIPDSLAARTFGAALEPSADWRRGGIRAVLPRYLGGLPWWFARGDSASLHAMARRGTAVAAAPSSGIAELRARYLAAAAFAYLALLRGDSAGAIRRFEAIPDSLCIFAGCFREKLTLARVLAGRGDDRRAAAVLDEWIDAGMIGPLRVLASLERARIADRLGDRAAARSHYGFVLAAWRRPDAELMSFVEEARDGLERPAP